MYLIAAINTPNALNGKKFSDMERPFSVPVPKVLPKSAYT
jgi:hypothetical protein